MHVVAKFDKFVKCSHGSIDATGFVRLEIGQWFSLCFAYIMFGGGGGYLGRAGLFVDLVVTFYLFLAYWYNRIIGSNLGC